MNIAVLGAGHIAGKMSRTLRLMAEKGADVTLYAAASRNLEKAQDFAREHGYQKAYGSYEEMLADPQVDVVYVATPHSHHGQHMEMCIAHGKHVLCEKAFTGNAHQARRVLTMAREKGVLAAEAIWTRYMPSRQIISDILASGEIGEVRTVTASLCYDIIDRPRLHLPELAGGALLDLGVYVLNLAAMTLGSDWTQAQGHVVLTDTGVDAGENITLTYADDRRAHLIADATYHSDRRAVIYGSKGYLTLDNVVNPRVMNLYDLWDTHIRTVAAPEQLTGYEYEVEACLRAIAAGQTEVPEMPHTEILRIMETMDDLRSQWGVRYPFD